jgi:hypothetical protein
VCQFRTFLHVSVVHASYSGIALPQRAGPGLHSPAPREAGTTLTPIVAFPCVRTIAGANVVSCCTFDTMHRVSGGDLRSSDRVGGRDGMLDLLGAVVVVVVVSGGVSVALVSPGMPLRIKRRNQKALVVRCARELAESGRFENWQGIVFQLRFFDGFPKADVWIDGPIRNELDLLCRNARIRRSTSASRKTVG